jgi:EmrB/QacA subfamily drug resistance transporter
MSVSDELSAATRRREWYVLAIVCLGLFMILLDTTIVHIAVPALTTSLSATLDQILWIVSAYTIAYAALLITGGRLGDLLGQKRLFLAGLALFIVASAACGLAQSPAQLIATRLVQGVGGAMLAPQTLAMITVVFPANRRGVAFGIWGAVAGLATVAGPPLGGWLVDALGWRWIFFVNVPIGILALMLAGAMLPDIRLNRAHRLDWLGTGLASLGLVLVCFGLIEGPSHGWGHVWGFVSVPLILASGCAVLVLLAWQQSEHRNREPLVPPGIFADRNFAVMSAVLAAISFGILGLLLPLVIFLQSVAGLSPLQAGLILAPMSLASVASAPLAGRSTDRHGGREILISGLVLWASGVGLVILATRPFYDRFELILGLVVAGFGLGMTFAPLQSIAMQNIEARMAGAAAGVMNTARQLGAVLGSAATGAVLQMQLAARLGESAERNGDALPESFRGHFLEGFQRAAQAKGLEVGTGQAGAHVPPDIPASIRPAIEQIGLKTFHEAYIPAMRVTLILPLAVLILAVIGAMVVRREPRQEPDRPRRGSTQMTSTS